MGSLYKVNAKLKFQTSGKEQVTYNGELVTYNGEAVFYGGSSTPTDFDPITNEPIFNTNQSIVEVSLEQSGKLDESVLQGTDETTVYLTGRCINPKTLTDTERKNQKVDCEIQIGNNWYPGKIELKPAPVSRLGLEKYFGEALHGYFSIDI